MLVAELMLSVCLALGNPADVCEKVPEPIVQVGPYIELYRANGFFTSEYPEYLFLALGQDQKLAEVVFVHELTHYIDFWTTGFVGMDSCEVESRAYDISNMYAISNGLSAYARWNWRDFYPGCEIG